MAAAVIDLFSRQEVPQGGDVVLRAVPELERPQEDVLVAEFLGRYESKKTVEEYGRDIRYWRQFLTAADSGLYVARTVQGTAWSTFEMDVNERPPATMRRYLSTVTSLYAYAQAEGHHDRNPTRNVRRPQSLANMQYLGPSLADMERLAAHLRREPDLRLRASVGVLMTTGIRVSELCRARVESLRMRDGKWWLKVTRKGGYLDEVEVPAGTVEVLFAYLGGRASGPLIFGDQGRAVSRTSVWRWVRQLGATVLPHLPEGLHPHDFRHAFVTAVLVLTGEVTEAQWRAGHRDIKSTMIYVHALTAQESTTSDRLEKLFGLTC